MRPPPREPSRLEPRRVAPAGETSPGARATRPSADSDASLELAATDATDEGVLEESATDTEPSLAAIATPATLLCAWCRGPIADSNIVLGSNADFVALASKTNAAIKAMGTWAAGGTGDGYTPPVVGDQPVPNVGSTVVQSE